MDRNYLLLKNKEFTSQVMFFVVYTEKVLTCLRLLLKMLGELVITRAQEARLEFVSPDLAVKHVVRSNRESFRGELFLGIVYEVEDETLFLSSLASTHEVCPQDNKRGVLYI